MNKIIVLWSHPRSLSTPFERIFMERGDFKILHEPFSYLYYIHEAQAPCPYRHEDPDHPTSYEDIKQYILEHAEKSPVFIKDMAYHPYNHVMNDEEFLRRLTNTFIIRDVEKTILSHAVMNPEVTRDEIGYELEYNLFQKVAELTAETPVVVSADELEDDPEGVVKAYCHAVGIEYLPESLSWEAGEKKEWEVWKEWHTDAARSSGIVKNMETFDFGLDDRPNLRAYYEYSLPFYETLYEKRAKPKE
jgi:hypothetical protein